MFNKKDAVTKLKEGINALYITECLSSEMNGICEIIANNNIIGITIDQSRDENIMIILNTLLKKNTKIQSIKFYRSGFTEEMIQKFSEILTQTTCISEITLNTPSFMDPNFGIEYLLSAMSKNTSIKSLTLKNIKLDDNASKALYYSLRHNTTIRILKLEINQLGSKNVDWIINLVKENPNLTNVTIPMNDVCGDKLIELDSWFIDESKIEERRMNSVMHRARRVKAIR